MELVGERVRLRPLREADVPRLAEIGAEPAVARWWPDLDEAALRRKLAGDGSVPFAIVHEDAVVGLIEYWENDDPDYRHAGIDLCLAKRLHGRGLGRDALATMARYLVRDRGHHRLVIDPALANERAVRCYEAVGFRRVGVMRRYERGPDGDWRDALLLDLLADEPEL